MTVSLSIKTFFIVFLSLCLGASCIYIGPFFTMGILVFIFLVFFSFKNIKVIFYALFLWSVFIGIFANLTALGNISGINYVDEILVSILVINILLKLKHQKDIYGISKLILIMFLFVIFVLISTLFNKSSYFALLNFLSTYLKFFLIFISAVIFLEPKELKKLIIFMLFVVLLQFVIGNVQFFTFGRGDILVGPEITLPDDAACGSFGLYGAQLLGHFSTIFFILSTSLYFFTLERKWLFFSAVCLYTFIISFTEHDYIFFVFFLLMSINIVLKRRISMPLRFFLLFGITILVFSLLSLTFKTSAGPMKRYTEYFSNPQKLKASGKLQSLVLVKNIVFSQPANVLMGVGPGTFSSGIAEKIGGEYYRKYIEFRVRGIESMIDYWWSNFSSLLSEIGIVGYLLYASGFFMIFLTLFKSYRLNLPLDNFTLGVTFASINIIIFLLFLSFMSNALEWVAITFPPAIISAYAWKAFQSYKT